MGERPALGAAGRPEGGGQGGVGKSGARARKREAVGNSPVASIGSDTRILSSGEKESGSLFRYSVGCHGGAGGQLRGAANEKRIFFFFFSLILTSKVFSSLTRPRW